MTPRTPKKFFDRVLCFFGVHGLIHLPDRTICAYCPYEKATKRC